MHDTKRESPGHSRLRSCAGALTALAILGAPALAGAADWRQTLVLYGMGAAMDGTTQIGDLKVPVDASISDVFNALEFGAMAAWRIENGTWSFTGDATYMGLGGTGKSGGGRVKGDVQLDQATFMATVGRRWTDQLEVLFSLSYLDLSTDVKVRTTILGNETTTKASEGASWVDPLIGLNYNVPFADDWRLNLRADIGGFGVGSDFSYQLLANVAWQASERVGIVAGYRVLGFDYEEGHGAHYERYDLTEQGPLVGVKFTF